MDTITKQMMHEGEGKEEQWFTFMIVSAKLSLKLNNDNRNTNRNVFIISS